MVTDPPVRRSPDPRLTVVGQLRMLVEALAHSLGSSARVRTVVLEKPTSAATVRDAVLRSKPDAVLLVLAGTDTIDAHGVIAALAARGHRVIVTGEIGGTEVTHELLASGATACHPHGLEQVRRLVSVVLRRSVTPRPTVEGEPPPASERRIRRNLGCLSPTEARILWRLMVGRSVVEIAREHVVSIETVRSQIRMVLVKMETTSQLSAVAQAWSVGWRPAPGGLDAA